MAVKVDSESSSSVAALRKSRVVNAYTPSYTFSRFLRSQSLPPGVSSSSFSCAGGELSLGDGGSTAHERTHLSDVLLDAAVVAKHEVKLHGREHQVHLLPQRNRLRGESELKVGGKAATTHLLLGLGQRGLGRRLRSIVSAGHGFARRVGAPCPRF